MGPNARPLTHSRGCRPGLLQKPPSGLVLLLSTDTLPSDAGSPADTAQRPLCGGPHSCRAEEHLGGVGAGRSTRAEGKEQAPERWGGCAQKEWFDFQMSPCASVPPPGPSYRPCSKLLPLRSLPIPHAPAVPAPKALPSPFSSLSLSLFYSHDSPPIISLLSDLPPPSGLPVLASASGPHVSLCSWRRGRRGAVDCCLYALLEASC